VLLRIIPNVSTLIATILLTDVILSAMVRSAQFRTFLILTNHNTGFIDPSRKAGPRETYRIVPPAGNGQFRRILNHASMTGYLFSSAAAALYGHDNLLSKVITQSAARKSTSSIF
jgi:hypothetical protein